MNWVCLITDKKVDRMAPSSGIGHACGFKVKLKIEINYEKVSTNSGSAVTAYL